MLNIFVSGRNLAKKIFITFFLFFFQVKEEKKEEPEEESDDDMGFGLFD